MPVSETPLFPAAGTARDATAPAERAVPPRVTIERLRPRLKEFGITRLARQTGLDRLGIPCWAAFRPNALTLSNSQGKGLDDDAACASALMEAVEFAIAESPAIPMQLGTIDGLRARGAQVLDLSRQMPIGQPLPGGTTLPFLTGYDLFAPHTSVHVPADGVVLAARRSAPAGLSRSTNGLASGNIPEEAIFHALCELVERDSTTLSGLTRTRQPLTTVPLDLFDSPELDALATRIADAGLSLYLTEETSDLGIPAFRAVIAEDGSRYFDLAAGYGCHPVPARAALRAITEAAQTRVTNIAGSRDDFLPHEYERRADRSVLERLRAASRVRRLRAPGLAAGARLDRLLAFVTGQLRDHGVTDITVVPLGGEAHGITVLKLFAPALEDRPPNRNWRPGRRAVSTMMAAA